MLTTSAGIGASVTSSLTAKVAAGTLAAGLATGGVATVTGDVPGATADVMNETAAAAHLEIDLPGPYLFLDGEGVVEIGDGDHLAVLSGGGNADGAAGGDDGADETSESDEAGKLAAKSAGPDDAASGDRTTAHDSDESSDSGEDGAVSGEATFDVGTAGSISAAYDAEREIVITGIEESAGYTAHVLATADDFVEVEFRSAGDAYVVLLRDLHGEIVATVSGSADVDYDAGTDGSLVLDENGVSADADADADADGDAESDADAVTRFDS